jgi:metacaspase-1
MLRTQAQEKYREIRKDLKHDGTYLPMVYESCGERVCNRVSARRDLHGVFTYAMAGILRRHKDAGQRVTFRQLEQETAEFLNNLHYKQHPVLAGQRDLLAKSVREK